MVRLLISAGARLSGRRHDIGDLLTQYAARSPEEIDRLVDSCLRSEPVAMDLTASDAQEFRRRARAIGMGVTVLSEAERLLLDKYGPSGLWSGVELWLPHAAALEFIDDCEAYRLVIVGWKPMCVQPDGKYELLLSGGDCSSIWREPDAIARTAGFARLHLRDGLPDGADFVTFDVREPAALMT